jgi:APA family basic amino acid/polyamine antiporter
MASVCAVSLLAIERLLGGVWSALAVLCGGAVSLTLARRFARMATVLPGGAGLLTYVSRGLGRRLGLLLALPYLLLSLFLVGAEATVVGLLLAKAMGLPAFWGSLLFLFGTWALCRAGRRLSLRAEVLATAALVASLVTLSVLALAEAAAHGQLGLRLLSPLPSPLRFLSAIGQALFLFMGFELVTCQADIASPAALGRALRGSVCVLAGFYATLALGLSCLHLSPSAIPSHGGALLPQLALAEGVGGHAAALMVALLSLLASYSSVNGGLLSLSRLTAALAAQGSLPRRLAAVDGRTLMPRAALLALFFVCITATAIVQGAALLLPAILAGAAAAALAYAAVAWSRERTPFREAGRGGLRRLGGRGLAVLLFSLALGVIADKSAAAVRPMLLGLLCAAYVAAFAMGLRPFLRPLKTARRRPCPSI